MSNPNIVTSSTKVSSKSTPDGYILGPNSTDLLGFYGLATPIAKPTVTGVAATGSAILSLVTALKNLGLVTDSTTLT